MESIDSLYDVKPGVPVAVEPVWWDTRLPLSANIGTVERYIGLYSPFLPEGAFIDEASIMVPGQYGMEAVREQLMAGGWRGFNQATDLVFTNPMGTRYIVHYAFFQHPGFPWRIEVMWQGRGTRDQNTGFSPLHQALWYPNGRKPNFENWPELPIPHLSFKPVRTTEPVNVDGTRALRHVLEQGFVLAQACQSTYGHFWYCLNVNAARQIYLKPRVNVRDAS